MLRVLHGRSWWVICTSGLASTPHRRALSGTPQLDDPSVWRKLLNVVLPKAPQAPPVQPAQQMGRATARYPGRQQAPKAIAAVQHSYKQRQQKQAAGEGPAMVELGKPAEQVAAVLFKASMVMVTLPLAFYVLCEHVLVGHLVQQLGSKDLRQRHGALRRIPSHLFCSYLAASFDAQDGPALVALLMRDSPPREWAPELLLCLTHLAQYPGTREALIMANVVDALEQLLHSQWFPANLQPQAEQLYMELHAGRRQAMAAVFETDGRQRATSSTS